jgi:hypothetical protein
MSEIEHVEVDEETEDDWEYVADPAELFSLGNEKTFTRLVRQMVEHEAPRRFALVEEIGERKDAEIIAWGIAFDDHAEVVSAAHDGVRAIFSSAERAQQRLSNHEKIKVRLVWIDDQRLDQPPSRIPPEYKWWGWKALTGQVI